MATKSASGSDAFAKAFSASLNLRHCVLVLSLRLVSVLLGFVQQDSLSGDRLRPDELCLSRCNGPLASRHCLGHSSESLHPSVQLSRGCILRVKSHEF